MDLAKVLSDKPENGWLATWVWCDALKDIDNAYLLFRRQICVDNISESVACWVSANSVYELYINGHYVGRGPSPSYPAYQYFDSYDISRYLITGVNTFAARCYNYGPTMQSVLKQNPGPGGFLLQVEIDGQCVLKSDDNWHVTVDPSRKQDTELISGHRGAFKEVCDARKEIIGWMRPAFDISLWDNACVLGPAICEPWSSLIPREIPHLRQEPVYPQDAFFHTCGMTYGASNYDVASPECLNDLRDDLVAVMLVASGVRLIFTASSIPKSLHVSTQSDRVRSADGNRKAYQRIGGVLEFWADD